MGGMCGTISKYVNNSNRCYLSWFCEDEATRLLASFPGYKRSGLVDTVYNVHVKLHTHDKHRCIGEPTR